MWNANIQLKVPDILKILHKNNKIPGFWGPPQKKTVLNFTLSLISITIAFSADVNTFDKDSDLNTTDNVALSATGSKPFKIPHPLVGLSTTKNLVHAAIEGPQCDNIYRGKTTLVAGISTVNIDTNAGMSEGTFATLNRDVQCFTTNETGWTPIKGSVSGNQLTILAQDNSCTDTISWLVVGERQDDNIVNNTMTDSEGHLIVEPDFEEITEPDNPGAFASGSSQIGEDGSDQTYTQPIS